MLAVVGGSKPTPVAAAPRDDCTSIIVPTETATPEPTDTATPEPTETATPEPTETATPDPIPTATPELTATPTPEVTETPTAEPTETPTAQPTETATPDPTETATPTDTPDPVPTETAALRRGRVDCVQQNSTTSQSVEKTSSNSFNTIVPATAVVPTPAAGSALMVVRMSGVLTKTGAKIQRFSVQAPIGARVSIRCHSGTCPTRRMQTRLARPSMRVHRFERALRAGTVLIVRVRVAHSVGKYTRFQIRRGRVPLRRDACLRGGTRPVAC